MNVSHALQQALQARNEGRLADAQALLAKLLLQQPERAQALYLLAEMAHVQGQLTAAEDLLVRALRAQPALAQAWARLGEVQEDLGRWADAEASFKRAAELKPDYIQAHYNRARLLRQLGQPQAAAQSLTQALRLKPVSTTLLAQMLQLRALLQEEAGQWQEAVATLDQAIAAEPRRAALHHNRGVLLQHLAQPAQALQAHDTALALGLGQGGPGAADAHYNRGNSLQSLGRSAEALVAYRTALSLDPQHALALYDLARLRWRMGDAGFAAELDEAAAAAPQSAVAPGIKGRLLLRAERYSEAAAAYAQAAALADTAAGYFDGLGQALAHLGRHDEALAAHRRAVELAPQQAATHISHASSLLQAGQVALAAQVAETAVRLAPLDQQAWALLGVAWRAAAGFDGGVYGIGQPNLLHGLHGLRDPREAWLNDYQQHVQVYDLPPPEGWPDAASFNQALAAALAPLHTDAQAPIDQTLRHGSQTLGNIFEQEHPLVLQLRQLIAQAVDRYIAHLAALPRDDDHPLLGRASARWRFSDSWSSRLRSSGFHTHHVHPHGWISSCYYVALPSAVAAPGSGMGAAIKPGQPGWITFGAPDIAVPGHGHLAPMRAVQPQVGRLVLFPSFMWHGTVPFVDEQPRLTVAFDLLPLD